MEPWWLKHSGDLAKGIFVAGFLIIGMWETLRQWRVLALSASKRWLLHGFLLILAGTTTSLLFRVSAVALAVAVGRSPYGVLNRPWLPFAFRAPLTFLLLDFVQYANHYLRHSVPLLWRIHQLHHADRDVDLSTGARFHPGEVWFTQGVYLLVIAATAPPPFVVLCFELYNIVQAFLSHANISLPPRIEGALRLIQVTPGLHRIHHSVEAADQRANLGVVFSFWDRFFHTYRGHPRCGEDRLQFGLQEVSATQSVQLLPMLALPFLSRTAPLSTSSGAEQPTLGVGR
jgi:sterol desaturase/sphingolipid hydroxylase (fatty acid hydroxylase superfamily)